MLDTTVLLLLTTCLIALFMCSQLGRYCCLGCNSHIKCIIWTERQSVRRHNWQAGVRVSTRTIRNRYCAECIKRLYLEWKAHVKHRSGTAEMVEKVAVADFCNVHVFLSVGRSVFVAHYGVVIPKEEKKLPSMWSLFLGCHTSIRRRSFRLISNGFKLNWRKKFKVKQTMDFPQVF